MATQAVYSHDLPLIVKLLRLYLPQTVYLFRQCTIMAYLRECRSAQSAVICLLHSIDVVELQLSVYSLPRIEVTRCVMSRWSGGLGGQVDGVLEALADLRTSTDAGTSSLLGRS